MVVRRFQADPSFPSGPVLQRFSAAVMFADVPGFTPLTESLAPQQDGAKQLTHLLNDYFGKLVAIIAKAWRRSGEIRRGRHGRRLAGSRRQPSRPRPGHSPGVPAALEAQASLHNYPVLDDRTLSLHVGIGAGDAMGFHVGGHTAHWEYTLAGPALEQMADADMSAPAPSCSHRKPGAWCATIAPETTWTAAS